VGAGAGVPRASATFLTLTAPILYRARQEVAAVGLAVVRLCVEVTIGIETLGAVGVLVVYA
jgi:hypothetical protein